MYRSRHALVASRRPLGDLACEVDRLKHAHELASLGMHRRDISRITGLSKLEASRLLPAAPPGFGRAYSPRRAIQESAVDAVESSVFAAIFAVIHESGVPSVAALVAAYRIYRARVDVANRRVKEAAAARGVTPHTLEPSVSASLAAELAGVMYGLWDREQECSLRTCSCCQSRYIDYVVSERCKARAGAHSDSPLGCPFCNLMQRYHQDLRMRLHFEMICPVVMERVARTTAGVQAAVQSNPSM